MTSDQQSASEGSSQPGKVRTWWHPLLVRLLDFELHAAYDVRGEVLVGKMPLRADILLIRREDGQLPESAARDLSALVERLNRFTLIEFKAPVDGLETGDLDYLLGCSHLFCAQQSPPMERSELTLIVLAPVMSEAFRADLGRRGLVAREQEPGIHRVEGPLFTTWMIEADPITGPHHPVLSLFSRLFLREPHRIIEQVTSPGFTPIVLYVMQQIQRFQRAAEGFKMAHTDIETMNQVYEDLKAAVLEGIPAEERLRGLPAEERLRGLSAEQLLAALSQEERAHLRALLESRK